LLDYSLSALLYSQHPSPSSPSAASSLQLWVALPQCLGGVPVPPGIQIAVAESEKALMQAMNSSSSSMFFGGHSLGGAMVQTLSQAMTAAGSPPLLPIDP
jgi:hypothetical protein